jgi:hypothetical protein
LYCEVARRPTAWPCEFIEYGLARRAVVSPVPLDQFQQQIGPLQKMQPRVYVAAVSRKSRRNAESLNTSRNGRWSWMLSLAIWITGHGSMSPQGLMWWVKPVAAGHSAPPRPSW